MSNRDRSYYNIKINPVTWAKYQGQKNRKNFRCIMLSERFLEDAKIQQLTSNQVLLYLACLLSMTNQATPEGRLSTVQLSFQSRLKPVQVSFGMRLLEELQLLSYVKVEPLKNRREKKGIEEKRNEMNQAEIQKPENPKQVEKPKRDESEPILKLEMQEAVVPSTSTDSSSRAETPGKILIAHYCELWEKTHRGKAPITGKDGGMMKTFAKDVGLEKAKILIEGYFQMPDPFLIKLAHPINLLIARKNEITRFVSSGKFVTMTTVRKTDEDLHYREKNIRSASTRSPEYQAELEKIFPSSKKMPLIEGPK